MTRNTEHGIGVAICDALDALLGHHDLVLQGIILQGTNGSVRVDMQSGPQEDDDAPPTLHWTLQPLPAQLPFPPGDAERFEEGDDDQEWEMEKRLLALLHDV